MNNFSEIFSERLFELVDGSELSLDEIADKICVSTNVLQRYMRGISRPNVHVLRKICVLFHVSADYLLGIRDKI